MTMQQVHQMKLHSVNHRFKIDLTLAKLSITSTADNNFFEIIRVVNGRVKRIVRSTEYAILEDNLARRTFDESGHYTLEPLKLEVREHLASGNNRGIFSVSDGGDASKLAIGVGLTLKHMFKDMKLIILQLNL